MVLRTIKHAHTGDFLGCVPRAIGVDDARTASAEDDFSAITTMLTPVLMFDGSTFAFLGFDVVGGKRGEGFPFVTEETFSADGESVNHNGAFYACAFR